MRSLCVAFLQDSLRPLSLEIFAFYKNNFCTFICGICISKQWPLFFEYLHFD
jgi:hypothetical protein